MIHVAAAVICKNGRILICQRGAGGNCEYLWEFPGGKQEPGETLEKCLVRECREELEIDIAVKDIFAETAYSYPDRKVALTFFHAELRKGEPVRKVHKDMKWVLPEELNYYEFCPADTGIVERLVKSLEFAGADDNGREYKGQ